MFCCVSWCAPPPPPPPFEKLQTAGNYQKLAKTGPGTPVAGNFIVETRLV